MEGSDALRRSRDQLDGRVAARSAELAALNQQLEQRVEERTRTLSLLNQQLQEEMRRREAAEEEIRRSEDRFRRVVEDQTEFIVRWLPDGTRTFANGSYCRFFGQPVEELIGSSFFALIPDEADRERVRSLSRSVTPEQPVVSYEHRVTRPGGREAWVQWRDRALFDDRGAVIEFQSVGRDMTPEKQAEERLQRLQVELAHAGRLSLMGEMIAAITHEVGQPLQAILSFASASQKALQAGRDDSLAKVQDWSARIQHQATRAAEIIKRLRNFTRLTEADRQLLDLNALVRESLELAAPDVRRGNARVYLELTPGLPPAAGDRVQIEQVLVNLVRNACEAVGDAAAEERRVNVATARESGSLRVSVCDAGKGMQDEELAKAFDPFFTTKANGTGIGLAICRRIVEGHGGRLWAERNPGRGMTFSFTLPAA